MELKTVYIQERTENFDDWIIQLASDNGFVVSVNRKNNARLYGIGRDGEQVAQVGVFQVGKRLKIQTARTLIQHTPERIARSDFIEILDNALQIDYQAEPIERNTSGALGYWLASGYKDMKTDDPDMESKRHEIVAELERGLPPIVQSEPTIAVQDAILPEIPPHPLKERREKVRALKLAGKSIKEIGRAIEDTNGSIAKKDLEWLRKKRLMPSR